MSHTIDSIPVAFSPPGGWAAWPPPILTGCTEPRPEGAPDLDGYWRTVEVLVDGESQPGHPALGRTLRNVPDTAVSRPVAAIAARHVFLTTVCSERL